MAKAKDRTDEKESTEIPGTTDPAQQQLATVVVESDEDLRAGFEAARNRQDEGMQTFINWLVENADTGDTDQYEVMAAILADIMESSNPAEALAEKSAVRASDILNQPLLLHSFAIRAGDYEESLVGHYAALTMSRIGSSTTRLVACGAVKVLMRLYKLAEFGEWPQVVMFTAREGKKGTIIDMVSPKI